mgnify:CR=1 FL=1
MLLTPTLDAAVAVVENPIFRDAKAFTPYGAWATEQRTYTGGELLKARYFAPDRTARKTEIASELTQLKHQREEHLRRRFFYEGRDFVENSAPQIIFCFISF